MKMEVKGVILFLLFIGCVSSQTSYKICISSLEAKTCQTLDNLNSHAQCQYIESKVDCAIALARGSADIGVFSAEETLLLTAQQPADGRILATIRDVDRLGPYAYEAVAVVPSSHTGGFEGLKGGKYCHPGLDHDERWSPRVLKTLEELAARTDRCDNKNTKGLTAEELEVQTLSQFFTASCRPGPWSYNVTVDAKLKSKYASLCSLCGDDSNCAGYTLDMGVSIAGVHNDNRHIQALECLRRNAADSKAVGLTAWTHVQEFFTIRNPQEATSFSLLCPNGTLQTLTLEVLRNATAPCALVRQPWATVVATSSRAVQALADIKTWWPNGTTPTNVNTWQEILFSSVIGGKNARLVFEDTLPSPANYTNTIRTIPSIDSTVNCLPARRWCTTSTSEQAKCNWVRHAAYILGVTPSLSCQQRSNVFECMKDIKDGNVEFLAISSHYGYLARQHFKLSPVKLVQNARTDARSFSRVAALVQETAVIANNVTRFENLKEKRACFPEFGGISYVAFVRTAHERGVIAHSECDYARAVGDLFSDGVCAPGAVDASHALDDKSSYNSSFLCSACRAADAGTSSAYTCAWDYSNLYFGNNGSLSCLAQNNADIAVLDMQDAQAHLNSLNLNASNFRVLCRNNTLALRTGLNVDENCLLAYVVDSEVVTRRDDPLNNALGVLLETLDKHFGYNAATHTQLINLEIFSAFDNINDLLFKNTAVGFSEPTDYAENEQARNYVDLFKHLETCTGSASRNVFSLATVLIVVFIKFLFN